MRKSINFWRAFADHPPALVRLYARRRIGRAIEAITAEEIAITSGIPLARVQEISSKLTWDEVSIAEAERFCLGAGFDPTSAKDRNRERSYSLKCRQLKLNRPFPWLKRHPRFTSEFLPLIVALKTSLLGSSRSFLAPESPTKS